MVLFQRRNRSAKGETATSDEQVRNLRTALAACHGVVRREKYWLIGVVAALVVVTGVFFVVNRKPLMQAVAHLVPVLSSEPTIQGFDAAYAAYKKRDDARALEIARPLAEQGNARAQTLVGQIYQRGLSVPLDNSRALRWFRRAAAQGDATAQLQLGVMYTIGQGVPQNHSEAAKWYRLAANQGDAQAQYDLGVLYAVGDGIPADNVMAHMWFNLAAAHFPASEQRSREAAIHYRDLIATRMSSDAIVEAQQMARRWSTDRSERSAMPKSALASCRQTGCTPIKLGLSAPLSGGGPAPIVGRQVVKAVEAAVREINATGGLAGGPVELAIGDDRCDVGTVVPLTRRHIEQDKIRFLIGSICPHVAAEAAPFYSKAGVIEIIPAVTAVELTEQNTSIFRISPDDKQQATALGNYIKREHTGQKISVVYSDNILWRRIAELEKRTLPPEVEFEPLKEVPGANDRLAAKLKQNPKNVVYLLLEPSVAIELIGALRARGVKSLLIGGQRLLSRSFWQAAGRMAEGVQVIAPIQSLNAPEYRRVVDLLKQEDVVPDLVALYSYVAVKIWAESVRRAGSADPKKVLDALQSGEFATAIGPVAFDKTGNRRSVSYSILTWQDGHLTELGMSSPPPTTPSVTQPHSATGRPKDALRFEQPVPFGPVPIKGKTIKELANHIPLFPPTETKDEALWKRNCSACHKWDQQSLCQQGASYVANSDPILSQPHPFGGAFKLALVQWFKTGCQ